jgi:hypothetical protein
MMAGRDVPRETNSDGSGPDFPPATPIAILTAANDDTGHGFT